VRERTGRFVSVSFFMGWIREGWYTYPIGEAVGGEVAHLVDGGFCF
jgi:hypothetical protein